MTNSHDTGPEYISGIIFSIHTVINEYVQVSLQKTHRHYRSI